MASSSTGNLNLIWDQRNTIMKKPLPKIKATKHSFILVVFINMPFVLCKNSAM